MDILDRDNPVFSAYALYSILLSFKLFAVFFRIARLRFKKNVFISPEDTRLHPKSIVKYDDPDIERARRAHLNDLENIPVFWIVGFLYVLTKPSAIVAVNLFRGFFVARAIHTFVYTFVILPQPTRALAFFVGFIITAYMGMQVLIHFA